MREVSGFALYVKETYATTKSANPTTPHRDIMKIVAANYQSAKKPTKPTRTIDEEQAELEHQMEELEM